MFLIFIPLLSTALSLGPLCPPAHSPKTTPISSSRCPMPRQPHATGNSQQQIKVCTTLRPGNCQINICDNRLLSEISDLKFCICHLLSMLKPDRLYASICTVIDLVPDVLKGCSTFNLIHLFHNSCAMYLLYLQVLLMLQREVTCQRYRT